MTGLSDLVRKLTGIKKTSPSTSFNISSDYLEGLRTPIVEWQQPVVPGKAPEKPIRVINPRIPLAAYNIKAEWLENGEVRIHTTTPRMHLHSIPTNPESEDYKRDLEFLTKDLYGNPKVMAKYAFGGTKTAEETAERFKQLSDRFKTGDPYSAWMGYAGNTPVMMITLGHGEISGEAEIAIVVNPEVWGQGYATEAALLLWYIIPQWLRAVDYKITNQVTKINPTTGAQEQYADTAPLSTVAATSRKDNNFNHVLSKKLLFSVREENTRRYGDGEQSRSIFREKVEDLAQVVANTERARRTAGGRYLPPRPKAKL